MLVYDYFRSSAAFRLRIALNLKGITPERRYIHLANNAHRTAEYRAVNPQGFVPYLIDDDGFELSQSLAIIEYLDETHPEPPLLPTDAKDRALARSIAQIILPKPIQVMKTASTTSHVSDFTRMMWEVEAKHPPFVGSLLNMKFRMEIGSDERTKSAAKTKVRKAANSAK